MIQDDAGRKSCRVYSRVIDIGRRMQDVVYSANRLVQEVEADPQTSYRIRLEAQTLKRRLENIEKI